MADAPKIIQDEFSITHGNATFRLIWSGLLSPDDKADLLDWLKLVERRIQRMPDDSADRAAACGKPAPSQEDAGGGNSVGHPDDAGVAPSRRFDDDWAPNPNDDQGDVGVAPTKPQQET